MSKIDWKFAAEPPDQSSSEDDWSALVHSGHLRPKDILIDPEQIEAVSEAVSVLTSFFTAVRAAGIREEM
jgi:hypothetical protein